MTRLVISNQLLTPFTHDTVLLLRTNHDPLNGVANLVIAYFCELTTRCEDCRFIEQVGKISPCEAWCAPRHFVEINILGQGLIAGMHIEDLQATGVIRALHNNLSVKATRAHQRRIEHIRPIGGRHDDDAGIALETIQFINLKNNTDYDSHKILDELKNEKEQAKIAFDQYVDHLARGLSLVCNILDPDIIVLGGGMSNISYIYENVDEAFKKYIFSDTFDTKVVKNYHGDSSGVRGAAWLS